MTIKMCENYKNKERIELFDIIYDEFEKSPHPEHN